MNTLDLYIDHLKSLVKEETIKAAERGWIAAIHVVNAPQEAIAFANERGLTVRHLTPENRKKREQQALEIAKELWLQDNSDDQKWAETAWAEMATGDDWSQHALDLLEEAYKLMDEA